MTGILGGGYIQKNVKIWYWKCSQNLNRLVGSNTPFYFGRFFLVSERASIYTRCLQTKLTEIMRIWLKIIDPETESEQRVNFCLEPETSVYKWLFQIGCFQIITWNNHSFKTGCLGYQVSKHEDTLWFLVVVLYPTYESYEEADETFWNLEILRVCSTFFEFLTPFPSNKCYCWWFRNPKQPPAWDVQKLVNHGINTVPSTGDRRISEPWIVLQRPFGIWSKNSWTSGWFESLHVLSLNSHCFYVIEDGHEPNSRGLYAHYKAFL